MDFSNEQVSRRGDRDSLSVSVVSFEYDSIIHRDSIQRTVPKMSQDEDFDPKKSPKPEPLSSENKTEIHTDGKSTSKCTDFCCPGFIPKRYIFSFIGFLASTLCISLSTNLSLAIVSMVNRSNQSIIQVKSSNECLANEISSDELVEEKQILHQGEFHWSPETEGLALGAIYYGQLVGYLPGGRLAELYGGKRTLIGFLLLASVFTALVPVAARLSVYLFIACRFLVGIGVAPVFPVLFYLISRWIPDSERSFNASIILAGYGVGAFVSFLSAGVLCASNFLGGWPSVFYISGFCGLCWCLMCYLLVYETPNDHPTITTKEYEFISKNLGPTELKQIERIPWKSITTSVPFWSLAIGYFGQFWILGFYCTVQALYMGTILKLDSITNGELSCLPPLTRGLFACICSYPADWALEKGYVSVRFIRKFATFINSLFSCAGFIAILLAGCDPTLNTIFFTVGSLLGDFVTFGVCMGGVDIAPNLSGTVSGILGFVGVIPFFIIPALVGWSTKYERSMAQWRYVYYCTIAVVLTTTMVYLLFGTSDPQPWGSDNEAKPKDKQSIERKTNLREERT